MRFAGTEYEKVRQREVDSEAHADGGDFGGPRRNKQQLDQAPDRAGIGDKAGHLRQGKAEITAECEPSAVVATSHDKALEATIGNAST